MQEKGVSRKDMAKNNKVIIRGKITEEFSLDHEVRRERFYATKVAASRYDGTIDVIPVIISGFLLNSEILSEKNVGKTAEMRGQFRSRNEVGKDGKSHLKLFLFVKEFNFIDDDENQNEIFLRGYICKSPVYRRTSKAHKAISDLLIAVHRNYEQSDYLPCVAWNANAVRAGLMKIGDCIELEGRIQSRKYFKKDPSNPERGEWREAYEISINTMEKIEE